MILDAAGGVGGSPLAGTRVSRIWSSPLGWGSHPLGKCCVGIDHKSEPDGRRRGHDQSYLATGTPVKESRNVLKEAPAVNPWIIHGNHKNKKPK